MFLEEGQPQKVIYFLLKLSVLHSASDAGCHLGREPAVGRPGVDFPDLVACFFRVMGEVVSQELF